jgi:hypothetical protein
MPALAGAAHTGTARLRRANRGSSDENRGSTSILRRTRIDGRRFGAWSRTSTSYSGGRTFTVTARRSGELRPRGPKIKGRGSIQTLSRTWIRGWLRRRSAKVAWPRARSKVGGVPGMVPPRHVVAGEVLAKRG